MLLYCWALRFVFVHAKALGFLKDSARSVFAEKTPAVTRYLPVRFRRTTSARANRFFFFCLWLNTRLTLMHLVTPFYLLRG